MILCVCAVAALLAVTKLLDVVSTLQRIDYPRAERNAIARYMMIRLGTSSAAWLVFVLALIIIGVAFVAAMRGGTTMQALFIIVGVPISIVQGAAAHCNWTGRDNFITRHVRIIYAVLFRMTGR